MPIRAAETMPTCGELSAMVACMVLKPLAWSDTSHVHAVAVNVVMHADTDARQHRSLRSTCFVSVRSQPVNHCPWQPPEAADILNLSQSTPKAWEGLFFNQLGALTQY